MRPRPGRQADRESELDRRTLMKAAAGFSLALVPTLRGDAAPAGEMQVASNEVHPLVGVQISPHSLFDEGVEKTLDFLQETAAIDTLFLLTHGYYGAGPRPKSVLASHQGSPVRESWHRLPKIWVEHDERFFRDTPLRHRKPKDDLEFGGRNILEELREPLRRRGMKVYARFYEPNSQQGTGHIAAWERTVATDHFGNPGKWPCWNKPDYREFVRATVEDLCRNNPLDGLQYGAERGSPLSEVLLKGEPAECFCEDCSKRARQAGIDLVRAKAGYRELSDLMRNAARGTQPVDGVIITVLRIFQEHPEVLAWNREYLFCGQEINDEVYETAKSVDSRFEVGQHVDHQQSSWDPFFRAALSYERMARHNDFIKLIAYHDIFGPRLKSWVLERWNQSLLSEFSFSESLRLFYGVMGLDADQEPDATRLGRVGLTPDYVRRETRRCVDGVKGQAKVYCGIGFNVPWHGPQGVERFPGDPEDVHKAVLAALDAGASGVIASREYDEMRRDNLQAFGRAVRESQSKTPKAPARE